jgi:hypothetical protein
MENRGLFSRHRVLARAALCYNVRRWHAKQCGQTAVFTPRGHGMDSAQKKRAPLFTLNVDVLKPDLVSVARSDFDVLMRIGRGADRLWAALKVALDPRAPDKSVPTQRQNLASALDALYIFLRDLELTELAAKEIEELRQALLDANAGRQHPLFIPSKKTSKSAQEHPDYGQIWRARAHVVLAIRAQQALARLEGFPHTFDASLRHLVRHNGLNFLENLATGRSRTKLNNAESRLTHLFKLPENWERDLQRKKKPINQYASKLYATTCDAIDTYKRDPAKLRYIKSHCLKEAKYDGGARIPQCGKGRLATP